MLAGARAVRCVQDVVVGPPDDVWAWNKPARHAYKALCRGRTCMSDCQRRMSDTCSCGAPRDEYIAYGSPLSAHVFGPPKSPLSKGILFQTMNKGGAAARGAFASLASVLDAAPTARPLFSDSAYHLQRLLAGFAGAGVVLTPAQVKSLTDKQAMFTASHVAKTDRPDGVKRASIVTVHVPGVLSGKAISVCPDGTCCDTELGAMQQVKVNASVCTYTGSLHIDT